MLFKRILLGIMATSVIFSCAACKDKSEDTETATDITTTVSQATTTTAETTTVAEETTTVSTETTTVTNSQSSSDSLVKLPDIKADSKIYDAPTDSKRPSDSFISSVKGYTLKIKHPWNFGGTNATGGTSLTSNRKAANYVEQKYGVTIEEIGVFQDYNKLLQGEIAANKFEYQMYEVQSFNFSSYVKNNYMKNLRSAQNIAAVSFTESWYDYNCTQLAAIGGGQYGWTSFDADYTLPTGILYNKKLLKQANLEDPITLARKGQWTWSKLEEYALKLNTSSIDGFRLGAKDAAILYSSLMSSSGTNLVTLQTGKSPKSNVTTQAGQDALAQIETWVKKNVITFNQDEVWDANKKKFAEGKAGMVLASNDTLNSCTGSGLKDSVGIVPFPTKVASTEYKDVLHLVFMSFIPSYYNDDNEVAKMLFVRDEQLQQLYRYRETLFADLYSNYNLTSDSLAMAYMIKYGTTDPSGIKYTKYVGAENMLDPDGSDVDGVPNLTKIIHPVLSGGSASKAISGYADTLQKKYDSFWGSRVFTGNYSYNK